MQHEQPGQDAAGQRHNQGIEVRRNHLQAFHGTQDRNGRGNHAVGVKQARARHTDQQQPLRSASIFCRGAHRQRGECQDAAFAFVVGLHHIKNVLERDDNQQRPENHRQKAENIRFGHWNANVRGKTFPQGVQGAGANITVHDSQRAECQGRQAGSRSM